MNENEKKFVKILGIVAIVICLVLVIANRVVNNKAKELVNDSTEFVGTLSDGTLINTSEKLKEERVVESYKFGKIQITQVNNLVEVIAPVTNVGTEKLDQKTVEVTLLNKQGKEITKVEGLVPPLESNASAQLQSLIAVGVTGLEVNAYDAKIEIKAPVEQDVANIILENTVTEE